MSLPRRKQYLSIMINEFFGFSLLPVMFRYLSITRSGIILHLLCHVDNVRLLDRFETRKFTTGTLYLTATHTIFVETDGNRETWILHMHIASVEKLAITAKGSPIQIHCKTFQIVTFVMQRERDCMDVYDSLLELSRPNSVEELYAFHYSARDVDVQRSTDWDLFDMESEFTRMGLPNEEWSTTALNQNYEICESYPRLLYVPSSATSRVIHACASFRSRGRFPVLSYLHQKNKAVICRCSQPLSGFSARCVEDERMLEDIQGTNKTCHFLYVVDTRPRINAMVNRAQGKGYESPEFYTNINFQFIGIENIHVMRESLQKLIEVCELKNPSMSAFISGLESSGWLRHVKAILDTSIFIAKAVDKESAHVMVHCSDGWDRTAQVCSVASLLLDPFYRTIHGFQVLIVKEWITFGHKFQDRCGFLDGDPREISPVFTQFLDCVWQLYRQFPTAFQFNERFLLTLHDHCYSCQFGTFIANNIRDKELLKLSERTYSLWGYLRRHVNDFINPLYDCDSRQAQDVLIPKTNPQNVKFWAGMYNRFESGVHPRESIIERVAGLKDHCISLEDHIKMLQKMVQHYNKLLGRPPNHSIPGELLMSDSEDSERGGDSSDSSSPTDPAPRTLHEIAMVTPAGSHSDSVSTERRSSDAEFEFVGTMENGLLSMQDLARVVESVALDWKTLRSSGTCLCGGHFDHSSSKYHCWQCGELVCVRCVDKQIPLAGHYSQRPVSVCKSCYGLAQEQLSLLPD